MNALIHVLAVCFVAVVAVPARAVDPPRDVADLFPSGTLAYAELTNPAELAPQLAATFKGTALEDSIPFIHGRKDGAKTLMELQGKRDLAAVGLFASPEMLAEFKKLRVAVGLIGFTPNGEAEAALVVLTGDSPAAGLAARAFLTMTPTLRRVGMVSTVPVFQYRTPNVNYDQHGIPIVTNDKPPTDGPHELTFAYTSGLFVVGMSKAAVSHAIKRFLGEDKAGLTSTPLFKEAVATHRQTGLFYFINVPGFVASYDAANKIRGGTDELDVYAWLKLTANSKAVKSVAGCVRFRDGGVSATLAATFDPAHKSPLMDFLTGPGVKVELLHNAQRPATFAFAVTLPEKNRATSAIGFLDAIAKANGVLGRLPSDVVRELEAKFKVPVSEGLLGKTRAVTVVMPTKQELPKGGKAFPMLILHTEDAATATAWDSFLPKLIGDVTGATVLPQPGSETIEGVKVFSLAANGLPWNAPVHYARNGATFAIGLDRKLVAAAAVAAPATSVAGGNKPIPPLLDEPAVLFGAMTLVDAITAFIEKPQPLGPVVPVEGVPTLPNGLPLPQNLVDDAKKARKEFFAALGELSPATVVARRVGNELRIEVFQPKVQNGGLKSVIDTGSNWLDKWGNVEGGNRHGGFEGRQIYGKW